MIRRKAWGVTLLGIVGGLAMSTGVRWVPATAEQATPAEAVVAKYPSPDDVARQMRELNAARPGDVNAIREDFDLAVRSAVGLTLPRIQGYGQSVSAKTPLLRGIKTRQTLESTIARLREREGAEERVGFYRTHFEELAINEAPEPALVMMDVLAHGWDNWSQWDEEHEKLNEAREKVPDLHRVYAVRELQRLGHKPAIGLLLRTVVDDTTDPWVLGAAMSALMTIGNYIDVLEFYLEMGFNPAINARLRDRMVTSLGNLGNRLEAEGKADQQRWFWLRFAHSDIPMLWFPAQQALDRPVPRDYDWPKECAKWRLGNDPDPEVREAADKYLRRKGIMSRADPETGRLSPEDLAELQRLEAENED